MSSGDKEMSEPKPGHKRNGVIKRRMVDRKRRKIFCEFLPMVF